MSLSLAIFKHLHQQPMPLVTLLDTLDLPQHNASVHHAEFVVAQMQIKHLLAENEQGELACTDLAYTQEYSVI
ncbi:MULTISPECIES: hypothetical protein [Vibrio]|uniref:Uncharacterized protein n=2 Tax=Vibrio TaxID=662 RepID=F9S7B2_9VIBR|nr:MULTISPECIES: hypothetical protein [Vibrio]EGU31576.1 hypothetical protein VII00023_02354 [Vibrio ichthyoenteri ATCC 700023]ODS05190.1 hypothetical protein VSF3289_04331 [Vibrio scophthalmi]